jgi:hypothetical protein
MCSRYIRNLRRKLGIRPSKEEIREQTRLRVRRFASAQNPFIKNEFERNQLA